MIRNIYDNKFLEKIEKSDKFKEIEDKILKSIEFIKEI